MFSRIALVAMIEKLEHRMSYNSELGNDDICKDIQVQLNDYRAKLAVIYSDENDAWLAEQLVRLEA